MQISNAYNTADVLGSMDRGAQDDAKVCWFCDKPHGGLEAGRCPEWAPFARKVREYKG